MTRRSLRWLSASALTLVAAALVSHPIVPLYDGVGFPDEPYRFVDKPSKAGPPSTASSTLPLPLAESTNVLVQSGETGPQVLLAMAGRAVVTPVGAHTLKVTATPQAPHDQPSGATIAGNVYSVNVETDAGRAKVDSEQAHLYLRFPVGTKLAGGQPAMWFRSGKDPWQKLATFQAGNDIFQSSFVGSGDYALSVTTAATSSPTPTPARTNQLPWIVLGLLLVLTVIIVVLRRFSRQTHDRHPHH
jgi:hypothetical protein